MFDIEADAEMILVWSCLDFFPLWFFTLDSQPHLQQVRLRLAEGEWDFREKQIGVS